MKRTFLAKRNALLSSANLSWGSLALAFALIVLLLRLSAPDLFLQMFAPAFRVAEAIDTESHVFLSSFGDSAALTAKNERLAQENTTLALQNQALLEKDASVSALFGTATPPSGILAGVVARSPESPYDTLVLAGGRDAGVTLDMEAFGEGGVPLGVVSAVTLNFSRVTLFSAPGAVTHGWVGKTNLPLAIIGEGGGALQATLSRSADIVVGDTVFAPGPGMLPIGSVMRIDSDPSAPGVTLRIQSVLNPFSIAWVELRDTGAALKGAFLLATSTSL